MTTMNKILASAMKSGNKELKHARKTRDKSMLKDMATMVRALAYANMAKDSHRQRFNNNSNKVTIKNVSHFEDEDDELDWKNTNETTT